MFHDVAIDDSYKRLSHTMDLSAERFYDVVSQADAIRVKIGKELTPEAFLQYRIAVDRALQMKQALDYSIVDLQQFLNSSTPQLDENERHDMESVIASTSILARSTDARLLSFFDSDFGSQAKNH